MKRKTKPRGQHPHKALSAAFVRSVAQAGRYCDGNGLYLHVDPSGARRSVQRLVIRGTPRTLGLGGYAVVSLAEARDVALVNRKLARTGGDPLAERRHARGIPTFEESHRHGPCAAPPRLAQRQARDAMGYKVLSS